MIDLRTLGTLNVESEGRVLPSVLAQPKRLALLVYLVLATPRGFHRRDKLLPLFWPELDEEHARNSLSKALGYLRRSLGEGVLLTRGVEEVGVDREKLRCDVLAFEDALDRGDPQQAVSLYAGPFLDGFFLSEVPELERWLEAERQRLAQGYARALEELALQHEARGDLPAAVEYWRKVAAQDPLSSRAALRLMQALVAAGEPAAALQHGGLHKTLLAEELAIEATPEVDAFVEQLRAAVRDVQGLDGGSGAEAEAAGNPASGAGQPRSSSAETETGAIGSQAGHGDGGGRERLSPQPVLELPAPTGQPTRVAAVRRLGEAPARMPARMAARWSVAALLVIASAAVGFGALVGFADTTATSPDPLPASRVASAWDAVSDRSIAVLPFENLSADRENEYFSDGIMEDILINLSRIENLRVISRTSVMQYRGVHGSIPEIARRLSVAHVLEGSVRRAGDRVRITVQLIDARRDEPVWAETYDRELRDVFEIQEEVARQITHALRMNLSEREQARLAAAPTSNLVAYDYYLLGRHHWNRRTSEGFRSALEYFQRASQNDPGFALAHAGLADTYIIHALWAIQPHFEAVPQAKQAALRALALDSTSAEVHTSLAQVYVLEWDWLTAEQSFRQALTLNPNYTIARHWYGQFLMYMAQYDEAVRMAESARELDPLSPIINADLGHVYLEARRYPDAEAQFLRALELDPASPIALTGLAQTYERTGRGDDALRLYTRLQEVQGSPSFLLAAFHARQGRQQEGRHLFDAALEHRRSRGMYVRPAAVARTLVALGEFDEAFTWLEKGYAEHDSFLVLLLDSLDFDALRGDPRFADLLRRMNFPSPVRTR